MTNNEAILPSELIYYYNNHLGIYKIFAAKDYPDGKPLKEGKLEVPKINPIPIDFPVEIDCRTTSPEGDWMKEAFEQFRGMAVFDGNADEIPKYLYTYFKEAIQDNIPKPEGDVVEKGINIGNYFDKVQDCVNKLNKLQELTGEYIDKQGQILTKHLAKDGKGMLRPGEYMKDEFGNIITYEDEQKAGNLIYIVNKQKPL